MDVLMLYQHGIENVIAASGTSLSEEHAALLKRYTPEVVIVFDGGPHLGCRQHNGD